MSTTETIGCPFCNNANEVTSPDPEYTNVSNTDQHGAKRNIFAKVAIEKM
jgi:hypothetical protein